MYLVVRSLKHNNQKLEYQLQKGDIIKIGRIKFAVKEIAILEEDLMEVDDDLVSRKGHFANIETADDEQFFEFKEVEMLMNPTEVNNENNDLPTCRVCWRYQTEPDNPLIKNCACIGSIRFIHYQCLKKWLDAKKQQKTGENFTSIYWKTFECELCKEYYSLMIKANGEKLNLVEYERPPKSSYLILESLNSEKNTSRIIHIIKPGENKDTFKLGRGHESDLRINDISVSRCHALIKYRDGKFYLEDNLSKFGTLVLVKKRSPLVPGFNKAV